MKTLVLIFLLVAAGTPLLSQQLVLRGDYPDPSVVKIGDAFWASATTSNWAPLYPILQSKDLLHWTTKAHVFTSLPAWADYYFWAPEISYENGKVYVYYAAHKKGGNLCIAVASADKPEGPYTDHGPLMCEASGSIDAFPMRDEKGKLYLIWKEDANSVGKPTPVWAMEMNEGRTALLGNRTELFRNDSGTWEKNLVEGVSMVQHNGYYYAFYAAAACCGAACTYGVGIARSKTLLGPWEKYPSNPVLTGNDSWACPGHGTPVEKEGRHFFMYHAYNKKSNVYTGREGLIMEYVFTDDGWIRFQPGSKVVDSAQIDIHDFEDDFNGVSLPLSWQWSVFQKPVYTINNGNVQLNALAEAPGAFLGQKTMAADYVVNAIIAANASTAAAGIAAIGDEKNMVKASYNNGKVTVLQLQDGKTTILATRNIPKRPTMQLQMQVANGKELRFFYSVNGKQYTSLHKNVINGAFLPPWDRAVRAGIVSQGAPGTKAVFRKFTIKYPLM